MNQRLTPILIALAAGFFLTTSCSKNNGDKETIVAIDKEFEIVPWEKLDDLGGTLQLRIATIQNQECGGTRINYATNSLNNQLTVSLKSLAYPLTCNGFAEPARDTINLSNLKKGDLPFNLTLKDVVINDGILHVEEGRYYFEMKKENGISMPKKEILRVPQGAIWGFISTDNGQDERVIVRLKAVDLNTGVVTTLMTLDSNAFAPNALFQFRSVPVCNPPWGFNFNRNAYFVEAILWKGTTAGNPGLTAVQISKTLC